MVSVNRVILAGNLTKDPQAYQTESGRSLAHFPVAVNKRWRGADGERKTDTTFLKVVVWNATADNCVKYLKKGKAVMVEGRLENRSYKDKDGNDRRITQVVGDQVTFLSPPSEVPQEAPQ